MNPGELNSCKCDKAYASLHIEIEAVKFRGNNNFYSKPLFPFQLRELLYVKYWTGFEKAEIGYIPE